MQATKCYLASWRNALECCGGSMESDASYFGRRANEERTAAIKSADPNARQSHLLMAKRYEELISAIQAHQ